MTEPGDVIRAEAGLRAAVRAAAGLTVVTGGQTGVDTEGAHAALRAGLPVHVIFPAGLRQEDGPLPAERRRLLADARVHELGQADFEYRTWTCVYVSDVVLLLDPAGGAGCAETARAARMLGRPLLTPEPGQLTAAHARAWLAQNAARVALIAGCRASLLARLGATRAARADIAEFMTAARSHDETLRAGGP